MSDHRDPIWHDLKTWPEYFRDVLNQLKPFEVRKADRDFRTCDYLTLREWDPETGDYTGRSVCRSISYVLPGGAFGVEEGYVVLGIYPV